VIGVEPIMWSVSIMQMRKSCTASQPLVTHIFHRDYSLRKNQARNKVEEMIVRRVVVTSPPLPLRLPERTTEK